MSVPAGEDDSTRVAAHAWRGTTHLCCEPGEQTTRAILVGTVDLRARTSDRRLIPSAGAPSWNLIDATHTLLGTHPACWEHGIPGSNKDRGFMIPFEPHLPQGSGMRFLTCAGTR